MSKTMAQTEAAKATEQEFKKAGFRVEKVGTTTVFERDVPDSVVEATRVLINGNGNGNGAKSDVTPARNGAAATATATAEKSTGGAG